MIINRKTVKSKPGMWIIYFVVLGLLVWISILGINRCLEYMSEDSLPTHVYTIEDDVISLRLPDTWTVTSGTKSGSITFESNTGYESLSIVKTSEQTLTEASIMYMLELRNMFVDVSTDKMSYSETTLNGKKTFATQILYNNKYYLCGVMESGNSIIRFVYSASVMAGEISDIDSIIGSINYRAKKQ